VEDSPEKQGLVGLENTERTKTKGNQHYYEYVYKNLHYWLAEH
jgi:hypothetical protein